MASLEKIINKNNLTNKAERNKQIFDAYINHGYTQRKIADYLCLHPSTVSKILKKERDKSESEYNKALKKCYEVAKQEAEAFSDKFPQLEETLNKSIKDLNKIIKIIDQGSDIQDEELEKTFKKFHDILKGELKSGLETVSNSLEKKRKHVSYITVTLFGRTKAGKSTLREALTHGDGSSIGKGGQRTTREVKEYFWNKLRIIDTPGIAAYKGKDDVEIAKSVLDESDLIFFLVTSDSIQPQEFEKLAEIRAHNKPVIILLNVKEDIDHSIRLKRFLNNFDKIISHKGQEGNIQRLVELSKENFEHSLIEILPIHALAAFKSHHTTNLVQKKKLYSASGINRLKVLLQEMIISQGTQKRIQSFRDDYIFYLNSFASTYQVFHGRIKPRISYLKKNHSKIIKWFDSFIPQGEQLIKDRVKEIFSPLYLQISSFIDVYAGNNDVKDQWKKKVEAIKIEEQSEKIGNEIKFEVQEYLEEFARELNFDMKAIDFDGQTDAVSGVRKGIKGKVLKWGSAILGLADGALTFVSAMNWWNPVGWITTGVIGIGSLITGIFSSVTGDDTKRYENEKQEAKRKIRNSTERMERETKNKISKWFDDEFVQTLENKLKIEINKLTSLEQYLSQLERDAKKIENQIMEEDRALFIKLFDQTSNKGKIFQNNIIAVAREQGSIAKLLIRDKKLFEDQERFENIIGERIIYVEYIDDDPVKLFQCAICPAKLNTDAISFDPKNMTYEIKIAKSQISEVVGHRESNIKTTRQLLQVQIKIEEV